MMDGGPFTGNAEVGNPHVEGNVDYSVDRISDLPAIVIQHILDKLTTEEAVRTSALSRKWRKQWMSLTRLKFIEHGLSVDQERSSFMNFVDTVMARRKPLDLEDFALLCDVHSDASRICSWVSYAVKHNAQSMFLSLRQFDDEPFELPHCLFTCDSIKVAFIDINVSLKLPSSIHFSNLVILSLQKVVFPSDHSTQRLFSGLPVLEKLILHSCSWFNVKAVTIALPKLQLLTMQESLANPDNCQFFIIAGNLRSFCYVGRLINNYCFYDTVSLWRVSLSLLGKDSIEHGDRHREVAFRADRILRGISCVKQLSLTAYTVEVLVYMEELYACMPLLCKLTRLVISSKGSRIDFGGSRTMTKFLQKTPDLVVLKFKSGIFLSGDYEDINQILDPVPSCFSSTLSMIKIYKFGGTYRELQVVKCLLKNAEKLLIMHISFLDEKLWGGSVTKEGVHAKIQEFPKASESCLIVFS